MTNRPHTKTVTQYRLETKRTPKGRWEFIPFTGAGPWNGVDGLERIQVRITGAAEESPKGWSFRIATRTITTTILTTDWTEL